MKWTPLNGRTLRALPLVKKSHHAFWMFCLLTVSGLFSQTAAAVPQLFFSPATQNVQLGDSVFVDIGITGLTASEAVGSFELQIEFDDAILSFVDFAFGDQLDVSGFGSDTTLDNIGGLIEITEFSNDTVAELLTLQADDFVLGTLEFSAIGLGESALDFFDAIVGDADYFPMPTLQSSGSVIVSESAATVAEPSTIACLLLGVVGLVLCRARQAKR